MALLGEAASSPSRVRFACAAFQVASKVYSKRWMAASRTISASISVARPAPQARRNREGAVPANWRVLAAQPPGVPWFAPPLLHALLPQNTFRQNARPKSGVGFAEVGEVYGKGDGAL